MKIENVTEENIVEMFIKGVDCGQVAFTYAADRIGLSSEDAMRIASAFGGGLGLGLTCGGITGVMMALGAKYGHYREEDMRERRKNIIKKRSEFIRRFKEANGGVTCKEFLKLDVSIPEEFDQALENELFFTICPKIVSEACKVLDEMLLEESK